MNKHDIIDKSRELLTQAEDSINELEHQKYCHAMSDLLDFLMVELIGGASNETQTCIDNYNP